jgi:hypothetical protein
LRRAPQQDEVGGGPGRYPARRGGRRRLAEEQPNCRGGRDRLARPEVRRPPRRRADDRPWVRPAERRVAPRRHGRPRRDERAKPPQVGQILPGDVRRVLLASLGDEVGLRDDGETAQVRYGLGRDHGTVLDAVTRPPPGRVKRRERQHQLHAGHAVHRGRPAGGVRRPHAVGELVQRWQPVVVEHDLHRPEADTAVRRRGEAGRRHAVQALPDRAVGPGGGERREIGVGQLGGGVGETGDTAGGGGGAHRGQVGRLTGNAGGEPAIEPPQPAGRPARTVAFHAVEAAWVEIAWVEAKPRHRRGVQHPQRAGAVLHADRAVRQHAVERQAIERPRDGLVIPHAPQPPACGQRRVGRAQPVPQFGRGPHRRRADRDAAVRGGEGPQVDVMVMQAGQQGVARGVDVRLAGRRAQARRALGHASAGDPDVGELAIAGRRSGRPYARVPDEHVHHSIDLRRLVKDVAPVAGTGGSVGE